MEFNVKVFGRIKEITDPSFTVCDIPDTDQLRVYLGKRYPTLQRLNYAIAVEKEIIHDNVLLNDKAEVALLPPFSGG